MRCPNAPTTLCLLATLLAATPARASDVAELLTRERDALNALDTLRRKTTARQAELDELAARRDQLDYQLSEARRRIDAFAKRLGGQRELLRRRLVVLYKLSRGGLVRRLLDAGNAVALGRNAALLSRIAVRDLREARLYRRELERLERERLALSARRLKQQRVERELVKARAALEGAVARQREALGRLRRDRRLSQARTRLEPAERELLAEIDRLRKQQRFTLAQGRLPRPVAGPIRTAFGPGEERASHTALLRTGVRFETHRGAEVRAIAAGVVRAARPLPGYGLVVLIDHGDGYHSVSAQLADLTPKPGTQVAAGTLLGHAGADPLDGTPGVYFELRRGARALDPARWLAGR